MVYECVWENIGGVESRDRARLEVRTVCILEYGGHYPDGEAGSKQEQCTAGEGALSICSLGGHVKDGQVQFLLLPHHHLLLLRLPLPLPLGIFGGFHPVCVGRRRCSSCRGQCRLREEKERKWKRVSRMFDEHGKRSGKGARPMGHDWLRG